MRSITYNAGAAAIARLAINAIGLVVVGILARTLGLERFGEYNAIFAYLFLFNALADMGLYTLLVREVSRPGAIEHHIVGNLFTLRFAIVLGAVLVADVIVFVLPYSHLIRMGVVIGSISIIGSSLVQVLLGVFQKYLKLHLISIADVIARLIQLIGVLLLVLQGHHGVLAFVWVVVVAEIIHVALAIFFARRLIPFSFSFDVSYWKKILTTAFPIAISLVFVLVYFKIDTVMLSLMKSAHEVGVYSVAYKVLEVIIFFPAMYVGLIMPMLSHDAHDPVAFRLIYRKTFRFLLATAIPAVVGTALFAGLAIRIVGGAGYEDAVGLLRILSLAIGIIFLGNLGGNALIALDLQRKGAWIYGMGAIINVVANLLFIPRFGATAAAWNTVFTELLVTVFMFYVIEKEIARTASRL